MGDPEAVVRRRRAAQLPFPVGVVWERNVHGAWAFTMSVPAFIDISEEDQAAELRAYLKSKGAEISEENSEGGLHVDLAQIIEACDVCLKEDDKGLFLNFLYYY